MGDLFCDYEHVGYFVRRHELRTPLTIVRGHPEVMGEDPSDRAETVALVIDELDRMSRPVVARAVDNAPRSDRAPRSEGAGLGLAIVQAVAHAQGGHVELDGGRGDGARFSAVIPACPSPPLGT